MDKTAVVKVVRDLRCQIQDIVVVFDVQKLTLATVRNKMVIVGTIPCEVAARALGCSWCLVP